MKIDVREIIEGKHVNKEFWVCDYRWHNYSHKSPIRHVKPTKILVSEFSDRQRTYYPKSMTCLVINSDGTFNKSPLPIYDKTSARFTDNSALRFFTTMEECIECYKEQCDKAIEGFNNYISLIEDKKSKILQNKLKY